MIFRIAPDAVQNFDRYTLEAVKANRFLSLHWPNGLEHDRLALGFRLIFRQEVIIVLYFDTDAPESLVIVIHCLGIAA